MKYLFTLFLLFNLCLKSATITWIGTTSTSTAIGSNWSGGVVPGATDDVILNAGAPNQPTLAANSTYLSITITGGTFSLNNKTLTVTTAAISGGTIMGISSVSSIFNAVNFNTLQSVVLRNCVLAKTFQAGGSMNISEGNLSATGNVVFRNQDDNIWRFSNSFADNFATTAVIGYNASSSGRIQIAYSYSTTYGGPVGITSSGTGGISFGENGGVTNLSNTTTGSFQTSGYTNGPLIINNLTQNGSTANHALVSPSSFTCYQSTFYGNFTLSTANFSNIQNSTFRATTTLTKLVGGSNDECYGGNTFNTNITITNNSANELRMSGTAGDSYLGTPIFNSSNSGKTQIAYNGTTNFAGNINLNSSSSGGFSFGEGTGITNITGTMQTTGFSNGNLICKNLTQSTSSANGTFTPSNFTAINSIFNGELTITSSTAGTIDLSGSTFARTTSLTTQAFNTVSNNLFNTSAGTTELIRIAGPGVNETWQGGNIFYGDVTIQNDEATLTLSGISGDDYNGNVTYIFTAAGSLILPASTGNSTYAKNINLNANTSTVFGNGGGKVIIDGNIVQNFQNVVSTTHTITNLEMSTSGTFNIEDNINITTTCSFNSGIITTGSNKYMHFSDGSSCSGMSNSSFAALTVKKTGDEAFTFPIGASNLYAPIQISAPAINTDQFTATYFNSSPHALYDVTLHVPSINHLSQCEYWTLDRTSGTSNIQVTLSWDTRSCGVTSISDLRVARWDGTQWTNEGNVSATGSLSAGTITSGSVSNFSPFTLSSINANNPLPIELILFEADWNSSNNAVDIKWETATEKNNNRFEIERSNDGLTWEKIQELKSNGDKTNITKYHTKDMDPIIGLSYYRLKQIDNNGHFTYSDLDEVNIHGFYKNLPYPNPAQHEFSIHVENLEQTEFYLTDAIGKKLRLIPISQIGSTANFILSDQPKGIYLLSIASSEGNFTYKLLIE